MTQTDAILEHMMTGSAITPLEALELYGSLRLGARIYEIRSRGIRVETETAHGFNGKRFARYRMKPEEIERVKKERSA